MSFELKSPHGLAEFEVRQQRWLGVDLLCVTQNISAKKSWQSFASDQATVSVILRQGGGFCEPRKRINVPLARTRYDAGFSMYIPSNTEIWGYGDSTNLVCDLRAVLSPGVFAVLPDDVFDKDHVATTAGFVIGERGALVIESMLNGDLASQLIGLVRKETSKPIRFLVNTSYHGDHAYGNYVFPESTIIVQHPATKRYMDEHFEDDRNFMLGLMGRGKGIERVQSRSADVVVSEMITVDLGGPMVEIRHLGFAQTPGDLVVWVRDAKVLWVGNMIQAPSPALPWLLEGRHHDTIETLNRVKEFLPEDAIIIPGHGKPMRPSDIDFPLNYLRELDGSVRKAIDEGRSADEAQDAVAMAHYGDYSLFEWAHKTVNVPAAYSHLQSKTT